MVVGGRESATAKLAGSLETTWRTSKEVSVSFLPGDRVQGLDCHRLIHTNTGEKGLLWKYNSCLC